MVGLLKLSQALPLATFGANRRLLKIPAYSTVHFSVIGVFVALISRYAAPFGQEHYWQREDYRNLDTMFSTDFIRREIDAINEKWREPTL